MKDLPKTYLLNWQGDHMTLALVGLITVLQAHLVDLWDRVHILDILQRLQAAFKSCYTAAYVVRGWGVASSVMLCCSCTCTAWTRTKGMQAESTKALPALWYQAG